MSTTSLQDVYVDQLHDLYSATNQSRVATKELLEHASSSELIEALKHGVGGISEGVNQLRSLFESHGVRAEGEFCKAMEGLVSEVRAHGIDGTFTDMAAKDATIISQYQRMTHYAIAGYGCLIAFASRLELPDDANTLQRCLDGCYQSEQVMTDLATCSINPARA